MAIEIPNDIKEISLELGREFQAGGFELNLVGGSVRDILLDRKLDDLDFSTNARPEEIKKILNDLKKKGQVQSIWSIGEKFGTIGGEIKNFKIEITTYRKDNYDKNSRKPEVEFGDSCEVDLSRRDFTINSIALKLPDFEIFDPFGGLNDLVQHTIKTPDDPHISFDEDPLRILRAFRFYSQLDEFNIETQTFAALVEMKERLEIVSKERIRDEFSKLILGKRPSATIDLLVETGVMDYIIPQFKDLKIPDPTKLHKDVYHHSLKVLDHMISIEDETEFDNVEGLDDSLSDPNNKLILRISALVHDIAKPVTKKVDPKSNKVSFLNHNIVGAKMSKQILSDLCYPNEIIQKVKLLVFEHLRFYGYNEQSWTDSAVRRFVIDAKDQVANLIKVTKSDITSENQKKIDYLNHGIDDLKQRIIELKEKEEFDKIRPALDGFEIMQILNLKPGPQDGPKIGQAYDYLMEVRLEQGEISKEDAQKLLIEKFKTF